MKRILLEQSLALDQVIGARRRARGKKYAMARRTKKPLPHDPYWDVVQSLMQNILTIYEAYRDKKPVMLFDMQEHRIYVYPYLEFKNDVSERSQRLLQDQYEQAMTDDKIVVFVRDNDNRKLVSYSV